MGTAENHSHHRTSADNFLPFQRDKNIHIFMKNGIGAVLLQADGEERRPVAYMSRAMTLAEFAMHKLKVLRTGICI